MSTSMYEVKKHNKRLVIMLGKELIYAPPDFVRPFIHSRQDLQKLADRFNKIGMRDLLAILDFEKDIRIVK